MSAQATSETRPPLVSVVIPNRDFGLFLGEAIESALAQTYSRIEIIVVDDASKDNSLEVLERFGSRIRVSRRSRPAGVAEARNQGVRRASGELLAFLDADDIWSPEKIELQCEALASRGAPTMAFCRAQQFSSPEVEPNNQARDVGSPMAGVIPSAMLIARDVYDRVGGFSAECGVAREWTDWYARAREAGISQIVLPQTLVRRRIHASNTGVVNRANRKVYAQALKQMLDRRRQLKRQI